MLFDLKRAKMPDVAVIFLDGAVAREGTAHGDVVDRGFGPSCFVFIEFVDFLAGFAVCVEVGDDEVDQTAVKNMKGKINGLFPVAVISTAATAAASAAGGQGNG